MSLSVWLARLGAGSNPDKGSTCVEVFREKEGEEGGDGHSVLL
jgi:hypothetical protein